MVKILLADDHNIVLEGLSMLLGQMNSLEIVGMVSNGQQALRFVETNQVDLIIADLNMPIMNGLGLVNEIQKNRYKINVILLSMVDEPDKIRDAIRLGVNGYLLKSSNRQEVERAIVTVMQGDSYFSPTITRKLAELTDEKSTGRPLQMGDIQTLTPREREVLFLVIQDLSNQQIAEQLFISPLTVETHRRNLFRKLDVSSALGLLRYALQNGMI